MKRVHQKAIGKMKVFTIHAKAFPVPLGTEDYLFLDRELNKETYLRFAEAALPLEFNFIFLPELLRQMEFPDISRAEFYEKLYDEYFDIYDEYFDALDLPEDFRFGIVHNSAIPYRAKQKDGTYIEQMSFTCCAFTEEIINELDNDLMLLLNGARTRITSSEALKRINQLIHPATHDDSSESDLFEGFPGYLPRYTRDTENLVDMAAEEDTDSNEYFKNTLREYKNKTRLFRLEYCRNYSGEKIKSPENIIYLAKDHLMLQATRKNHIAIKLQPSQLALYCHIQSFKKYGISKANLMNDVSKNLGKYRKLSTLFAVTTNSKYNVQNLMVQISQINRIITDSLSQRSASDSDNNSFNFEPYIDIIKIDINERYSISVSSNRFKPVIINANHYFEESPMEYIDNLKTD